jgi:hypothetical protein
MAREEEPAARVSTYRELVDEARQRLRWLLENVDPDIVGAQAPAQDRLGI